MEAELRRLMRELQHRVKNMLANVTALINQAQRQAGDTPAVMETLSKRIRALANTHNLLTATNWRPALLKEILAPELTDIYGNERVHLVGPPVRLNARATLGMSMVVHELSTNAAKYGSLSQPGGTVEILWQRTDRGEGEKFIFEWIERGGPAVSQPTRTGYGSDLIDLTVRGTLGGTIDKFFELSGFRCVVTVPIEKALGDGTNDDQSRSA
jgi:two-component system CheB/CheR fusion protein